MIYAYLVFKFGADRLYLYKVKNSKIIHIYVFKYLLYSLELKPQTHLQNTSSNEAVHELGPLFQTKSPTFRHLTRRRIAGKTDVSSPGKH